MRAAIRRFCAEGRVVSEMVKKALEG